MYKSEMINSPSVDEIALYKMYNSHLLPRKSQYINNFNHNSTIDQAPERMWYCDLLYLLSWMSSCVIQLRSAQSFYTITPTI